MKYISLFILGVFSFFTGSAQNAGFLTWPAISPDGQTIVFSFEGDLWKVSASGGTATRLTGMQGNETNARYSPDGKWIAFSARQTGNADIYVMPAEGGEIRQLTWHSVNDNMESWSWDSRSLYFSSGRYNSIAGYKLSADGGTPVRVLTDHFYSFDHNIFEHPSSGDIYFNDTWESANQLQRKGYKGPFNPDVQSWNPSTKKYKRYTNYEGKDFGATFDKQGNMYFMSDEGNGEYNLYTMKGDKKTALTKFPTSIKNAVVNASGGKVVFEKEYGIWLYDVAAAQAKQVPIRVNKNDVLPKEKDFDIRNTITDFDVSPDGKKLAFISRGELFVSDKDGKYIRQVEKGSAERAAEVKWLADNKTLLFTQTLNGYQNLYTIPADGSGSLKQLTSDGGDNRAISMNKNRSKAVYLSGRNEVRMLDLKTMTGNTIARDELWNFGVNPTFSPNEEYVCFTAIRNFEQDVFLYHIKDNKKINLTRTGVTETAPLWSPDGKYIYCTSSRLKPSYPFGLTDPHIYRIALDKYDEPYRSDKVDELFQTPPKKDSVKKDSIIPLAVNTDGIMERMELISPNFGSQNLLAVFRRGEKTITLFTSNHGEGRFSIWKHTQEPFEAPKTEKLNIPDLNPGGVTFVEAADKYYLLMNGTIFKVDIDANKNDAIAMGYTFRRNLREEFTQMFDEAWAAMETNYYDEQFHGRNWKSLKEQYRKYLPYVNNRSDFRVMMNDMLGELNSSHQGFTTAGDDENTLYASRTMETGIIFEPNNPYRVQKIVKRSPADKAGMNIRAGDVLAKVNGETVDAARDRNYYFTRPSADREMDLVFNRNGQMINVRIHPAQSIVNNLQDEWIDQCQDIVNRKTNNRVAYHCMKDMTRPEMDKFITDMTQDFYTKDAMILDLRYNRGGNVHDDVIDFLSRRAYLKWKYREGQFTTQPNFVPSDKPLVLLINEQSLSDAEMTAQGFKQLKLGQIVGMPTYRWIIFTSGTGLVDGSAVRLPSWGCYTLDGKDLEMNGVEPDIKVPLTIEDKINGSDPQLDRAIAEVLKQLK